MAQPEQQKHMSLDQTLFDTHKHNVDTLMKDVNAGFGGLTMAIAQTNDFAGRYIGEANDAIVKLFGEVAKLKEEVEELKKTVKEMEGIKKWIEKAPRAVDAMDG